MADNSKQIAASIDALFQGIDKLVTTKTVVGDAVRVDGAALPDSLISRTRIRSTRCLI